LVDTWNYLQCTETGDTSDPSRVDLFALNSYSWCGDSTFTTSSYNVLVSDFSNTSVPIFFSEYGCNKPAPRVFTEVPVIYGPLMTPVLSGGMVYEYSEEPDDYGLVQINSNGSAQILPDFDSLQKQFDTLNITYLQGLPAQNLSVTPPKCTSSLITTPGFDSNFTIPDVPPGAQTLIDNGISPAPVGKMVPVTATKVSQVVQQSNGDVIQNLAITILADDQSNNPGSVTSSGASPSATKKKNGGGNLKCSLIVLLGNASFAALWTSFL
jgi:1,3-beta-glucanosyltransferase GAS3